MTSPNNDSSQHPSETHKVQLSICDVMRDSTDQVIMKVESLFPSYIVNLADMQTEYLRIIRNLFGTCYIAEKELLDKMGVDQNAVKNFDKYFKVLTKSAISQIEIGDNLHKAFITNLMSTLKIYDECAKLILDRYAKVMTNISEMFPVRS